MSNTPYTPPQDILDNYAAVLVNYALNSGAGVKPGEVVMCAIPDVAKPLALALQNTLLRAGAQPIIRLLPTGFDKDFYSLANEQQLTFFPRELSKARVELMDHQIGIIADPDPKELSSVDPHKIIAARDAKKDYRDWLIHKETQGKLTWTIGLWGVQAKADEVGLTLKEYWDQIIKACFLDQEDPISEWRRIATMQKAILKTLNDMEIESLHVAGEDVDLTVQLGANRIWQGGSGRNIPSFEVFTSPNWRGTSGWIRFNQPLYRYGNVVKDVFLRFKDGLVVEATAAVGNELLQAMLKSPNANKVGEFSLTDKRMSRITHIMAETLYDENIGGPQGNTHIAIGMAYKDCYRGDATCLTKQEWESLGFNESAEHTDIVSTTKRRVTATLQDGSEVVMYDDGEFRV